MDIKYLFRRFIAFYIDVVVIFPIVSLVLYLFNITDIEYFSNIVFIFIFVSFIYFVVSDFFLGRTFGKILLRFSIHGYNKQDNVKFLLQVMIRNFVRFVPFDQISIFFYNNKMWHDIASKTYVEYIIKK